MSASGQDAEPTVPANEQPASPPPTYFDARSELAARFLQGDGIEIGPLHQPLATSPHARVKYVDRMGTDELRREYEELADWDLTEVDVIDDGETLTSIPAASQDFIIANHFLEHCENPIGTIETHLGKLKAGGVLFYAVPDGRYTFDFRRPVTPLEHIIADADEDPERSRHEHYVEWSRLVLGEGPAGTGEQAASEEWVQRTAQELEKTRYSIHMHVWTQAEFLRLIMTCRERFDGAFDLEAAARVGIEFIVILRKRGAFPDPPPPPKAPPEPAMTERERWESRARRAVAAVRRDIRRWRESK